MSIEQQFIDAINADPDNRLTQYVYADWLEDQGDPRGESWRVLLGEGKRPLLLSGDWLWWRDPDGCSWNGTFLAILTFKPFLTFHAAMDAAAVAWVRCHRDPEYMTAAEAELYRQAESLPVYDGPADPVPFRKRG